MSQEIIYTSAPRGLKPGSRGFCTVVSTQGMAKNLAERLESLSGYRQVFPPQDPKAHWNPVVHSHLRLSVGGRTLHVLSRISAHGLDYTQRANKFAHHVVLDPSELPAAGPAWLISAAGFLEETWDGEPRILAAGRKPPTGAAGAGICQAWRQLAGDAGWGGVLAETALDPVRQAVIVFRPGMEMLPLVVESLNLLPAESRWGITFSTYFTKLPPGIDCKWRCMLEGTPEILSARRSPHITVIDLCRPAGQPPGGWLIEAARTGVVVAQKAPAPSADNAEDDVDGWPAPSLPPAAASGLPQVAIAGEPAPVGLGPPPLKPGGSRTSPPQLRTFKKKRKRRWPLVLACSLLVVALLGGGGVAGWRIQKARSPNVADPTHVNPTSREKQPLKKVDLRRWQTPDPSPPKKPTNQAQKPTRSNRQVEQPTGPVATRAPDAPDTSAVEPLLDPSKAVPVKEAQDETKEAYLAVDLPEFMPTTLASANTERDETEILTLEVPAANACCMQLFVLPDANWRFRLDPVSASARSWSVTAESTSASALGAASFQIASFRLADDKLLFRWSGEHTSRLDNSILGNSILEIASDESAPQKGHTKTWRRFVALRTPKAVPPVDMVGVFTPGNEVRASTLITMDNLPSGSELALEIVCPKGDALLKTATLEPMRDKVRFSVSPPKGGGTSLEFHARLTSGDSNTALKVIVDYRGTRINLNYPRKSDKPGELIPVNLKQLETYIARLAGQQANLKAALPSAATSRDIESLTRKTKRVTHLKSEAEELYRLCKHLNDCWRLHYRVSAQAGEHGEHRIVLLESN